jgi:hypothetical protein
LRRWSYEGEVLLPDDPAAYYRVAVRCGFATPEDFRKALARWRRTIRKVYEKVFNARSTVTRSSSKQMGGQVTVIIEDVLGRYPTGPKDTKPVVDFILSHQPPPKSGLQNP